MWPWNWSAHLQFFAGASNRPAELRVEGRIIITAFKMAVYLIRKPFHLETVDARRSAAEPFQNWNAGGHMFRLERAG
jgi:hypothetical protein